MGARSPCRTQEAMERATMCSGGAVGCSTRLLGHNVATQGCVSALQCAETSLPDGHTRPRRIWGVLCSSEARARGIWQVTSAPRTPAGKTSAPGRSNGPKSAFRIFDPQGTSDLKERSSFKNHITAQAQLRLISWFWCNVVGLWCKTTPLARCSRWWALACFCVLRVGPGPKHNF